MTDEELPGGTLLGLGPHHNKEFALVLTIHRDDLVRAGLPRGLAEKVEDDALIEIGEQLGSSLTELGGYWDRLESILSSCGFGEDDMVERLLEDGWVEYKYCSRGVGAPDIHMRYLFHPDAGFDAEAWANKPFVHATFGGACGQYNCEFDIWLAGIDKKLYVKIETSQEEDEDDV